MAGIYFDNLTLSLGLIDLPEERHNRYVEYLVEMPGSHSPETDEVGDFGELTMQVREIAFANPLRPTDTFLLDTRLRDLSWGSDYSSVDFLLDVSVNITATGVIAGLAKFAKTYWPKKKARSYTDSELLEHARHLLARRYEIPYAKLEPAGIDRVSGPDARTTAHFDNEGTQLDITIIMVEGIPIVERSFRELPPSLG